MTPAIEGERAGRAAVPEPARIPLGAEPAHEQSGGLLVADEGPGRLARRGQQGRPAYPPEEGSA